MDKSCGYRIVLYNQVMVLNKHIFKYRILSGAQGHRKLAYPSRDEKAKYGAGGGHRPQSLAWEG
jgi:hypothetical protein